jgi:DNA replication and repair protein RecF
MEIVTIRALLCQCEFSILSFLFNEITTFHFRNLDSSKVPLSPKTNLFLGKNGQGKTNFLEAIFFLATGASFRTVSLPHFIQHGAQTQQAQIAAKATKDAQNFDLIALIEPRKKSLKVNGKRASRYQLQKLFPIVLFSPESLNAIKGSPEQRRRLLDTLLLTHRPNDASLLTDFNRALKSRNSLLRSFQDQTLSNQVSQRALLQSVTEVFLEKAIQLTLARLESLSDFEADFTHVVRALFGDQNVDIFVDYVASKVSFRDLSKTQMEEALRQRAEQLLPAEMASGTSLVGAHKHEIILFFNGQDSRFFSSQGQQRALIIAFKIAQILYHRRLHGTLPLLLLDDVMSELDEERRGFLLDFLSEVQGQTLVTTTDLELSAALKPTLGACYQLSEGRLEQYEV